MSTVPFKPLASLSSEDDVLINFNQKLGEWTYGPFYFGYSKSMNKKVMVKVVDLRKFPLHKNCLDTEISILKKLQSNNYITKFVAYKYYKNTMTIVTDICNQGNLKEYLQKSGPLPEDKALSLLLQIAYGLRAVHEAKFSHGSLRPENILLNEENGQLIPKISNFLFARSYMAESAVKSLPFDSLYLSPEVLKTRKYNQKSDIWSLGMIYYEMLYGRVPWTGKNMKELEECILNNKLEFPVVEGISETSTNFLSKCLERNLEKRIDWGDLMQHRLIFRGMFSKGNGTFKLFNDQFNEGLNSNKNIMYGLRRDASSKSISSSKSSALSARGDRSARKSYGAVRCQPDLLNKNIVMTNVTNNYETNEVAETVETKENYETKDNYDTKVSATPETIPTTLTSPVAGALKMNFKIDLKNLPLDKCLKMKSPSSAAVTDRPKSSRTTSSKGSCEALLKSRAKLDPKFYDSYLSKVDTTRKSYQPRVTHTQKSSMSNANNTFTKPLKILSVKTEMLGEIYKLIEENSGHPLYDSILKALERESEKLKVNVEAATESTEKFTQGILTTKAGVTEGEGQGQGQPLSARRTKSKSSSRKEKCKETHELLKEITAGLIEGNMDKGISNESMLRIAANFKVLREFEGIGENVGRELEALKDILLVFYRKKQFDHLKYLLLVKNYV